MKAIIIYFLFNCGFHLSFSDEPTTQGPHCPHCPTLSLDNDKERILNTTGDVLIKSSSSDRLKFSSRSVLNKRIADDFLSVDQGNEPLTKSKRFRFPHSHRHSRKHKKRQDDIDEEPLTEEPPAEAVVAGPEKIGDDASSGVRVCGRAGELMDTSTDFENCKSCECSPDRYAIICLPENCKKVNLPNSGDKQEATTDWFETKLK